MDDNKLNTGGNSTGQPEEPMEDAMAFSTSAQKAREEKEAEIQRAEQEQRLQKKEQEKQEKLRRKQTAEQKKEQEEQEKLRRKQAAEQKKEHTKEKRPIEERIKQKRRKNSLKKQDKLKRRRGKEFSEKEDPYYGLELKPLQEYQKEYEETLSFKPVRPEEQPSEMTGTFTYLFDGSGADHDDPEMKKKVKKLHEERSRRVSEVVRKSGTSDVAKEDIYSVTTSLDVNAIREAAEEQKQEQHLQTKEAEPKSTAEPPKENLEEDTPIQPPPQVPVQEPEPVHQQPQKEEVRRQIREPQERPAPAQALQQPQTKKDGVQSGEQIDYRPAGTPVHILDLQDLVTPVFNESREYPHSIPIKPTAPAAPQKPLYSNQPAGNITELPPVPAIQEAEGSRKPEQDSQKPTEEKRQMDRPPIVPFVQARHASVQEPEAKEGSVKDVSVRVPDRFVNSDEPVPDERPAAEVPRPGSHPETSAGEEKPAYHRYEAAAKAIVQDVDPNAPEEEPPKPRRKFLHRAQAEQQKTAEPQPASDAEENSPNNQVPKSLDAEEELEDYNSPGDAAAIFHQLGGDMRELILRLTVTGICVILELLIGFLGEYGIFGIRPFNITAYLICNLVFLAFSVGFCGVTIANGLKALFKLHANADSGIAVASLVGLVQGVASLFSQSSFAHGELHLYSAVVCGALFFNTLGKWILVRRVNRNFHYVTSPGKKYAAEKFDDHNTALQMAEGVTLDSPEIAYQHETGFLKNFLRLSYSDDPSDRSSQFLSPVLFCASLVLFIVMLLFIQPHNVSRAWTAFAAATCISVPIMNMLSVNLPLSRISRVAAQCGGMVIGFPAVQYFADTNAVLVDAQDLFPKGSIILNGIKTFGSMQMDDAIVDSAALMHAAGGPLSSLFGQIIRSRQEAMPKVENIQYEDGMGISGWVGGRRVFIGNRRLMVHHNVTLPDESIETRYVQGGKQIAYLAVSGELVAMFIVTYRADRHRTVELQRMEDNGISLIVRSNDANVTAPFIAALFGLDAHTVRVLPERLGQVYESIEKQPEKATNALIGTNGRPSTMMRLITACVRQRANISIAVVLQNVGAILGFVLVAFLCCQQGMQQISTLNMVLYELFWVLVIWLVPKLRKP